SGQRLQIHVGLQFGPVLEEGRDVFGDCVNVAARMVKLAKPSQIIAGGECVEALTGSMKDQTRALDKLPVKGREQEVEVYEVLWRQSEELTYMASRAPGPPDQAQVRLCLRRGRRGRRRSPRRASVPWRSAGRFRSRGCCRCADPCWSTSRRS